MKKGFLIFLMGIVSFLGINTVSAEEISTDNIKEYNYVESWVFANEDYINSSNVISYLYELNYEYYVKNYKNVYPYYSVYLNYNGEDHIEMEFFLFENIPSLTFNGVNSTFIDTQTGNFYPDDNMIRFITKYHNGTYHLPELLSGFVGYNPLFSGTSYVERYNFYNNFELLNVSDYVLKVNGLDMDNVGFTVNPGEVVPAWHNLKKLNIISDPDTPGISTYTEINLNQYSYVALSLKDYNNIPENNSSVYTNIWTKGQLCITPVYNYGMTERKDILTGTQVQRCSSYYNDFTSIRMYLLKTDVENHSIYYLKAYDTSKENIVKVDTSVFDITYITEDTKDNPYVSIGGKQYPTIAYDKLTDTATKSEDDDYNSGVSCPVGDLNCYNEYNSENIFDSVFDSPLKILKNIWSSITSVFDIITEFIMLLPEAMQSFLFLSFMIAIILGLIKIIL